MKIEVGTLHRDVLDKERATLVNFVHAVVLPSRFRSSESPLIITTDEVFKKGVVKVHAHMFYAIRDCNHAMHQRPDLSADAFVDIFPQSHQVSETQKNIAGKEPWNTHCAMRHVAREERAFTKISDQNETSDTN